jgi:hypothetical protein
MTSVSGLTGSMSSTSPKRCPIGFRPGKYSLAKLSLMTAYLAGPTSCAVKARPRDRNAQRSKVVRADLAKNRLFLDRRSFEILALDSILPCIALQKRHGGESNRSNTEGIHFARANFRIDRHSPTKLPRTRAVPG